HTGVGMENQPPLAVLQRWGYRGDEGIALFPPVLLDGIAADLILACDLEAGNDILAHYKGYRQGVQLGRPHRLCYTREVNRAT
ncbi:MAG: hypothetical protein DDG58_01560, partial [Ardenticatenia bacterium]